MTTTTVGSDRLRKAIERNRAKQARKANRSSTRVQVGKPMSSNFVNKRPPKRKVRKKTFFWKPSFSFSRPLLLLGWCFNFFLLVRMVAAENGLWDYLQAQNKMQQEIQSIHSIKDENLALIREIKRIDHDKSYQKKLVRDHLGVIASDEYLVLFSKGKSPQTN